MWILAAQMGGTSRKHLPDHHKFGASLPWPRIITVKQLSSWRPHFPSSCKGRWSLGTGPRNANAMRLEVRQLTFKLEICEADGHSPCSLSPLALKEKYFRTLGKGQATRDDA